MKTLYLKTTLKLLRLLPVLIFFTLVLSNNARSQGVAVNPVCYGEPIYLLCTYASGCGNPEATFHWENFSGSWTSSERDPVIYPPGSVQNPLGIGYATDRFYLSIQFQPPPGGFYGGRITVTVLAPIVINRVITPVICYGANTGAIDITVSGGQIPYSYLWSNGATTQDISGLTAGTYSVTVTDGRGCSQVSANFEVTQPANPVSITGTPTDVSCYNGNNGSITTVPANGTALPYSFIWSNGATTQDINNLTAGTYMVTVSDANNCKGTGSWTVNQPQSPVSISETIVNASCNGYTDGSITVTATGGTPGYTYLWSTGATTNQITGLGLGTYYVTVTDSQGCMEYGSYNVTQPEVLNATAVVADVNCKNDCNGTIDLTVTGGTAPYNYVWSNGATVEDLGDLCEGNFAVTVTDANNCVFMNNWTVGAPAALVVTGIPADAQCKNGCDGSINITAAGGTAPYLYSWSNATSLEDPAGLCEGTYFVTVTDAHGCEAFGNWTIGAPAALQVSGIATAASCSTYCDGAIDITVGGGVAPYTYLWSDPAGSVSEDVTGLCAGTYFVTITDAHNCTLVDSWTVTEPGEVSWEGSTTNVSCKGGANGTVTTIFTLGGTPPYTYLWSNGATTADLTGLTAGTYNLTVTDSHSCDARAFRTIYEPDELVVSLDGPTVPALCYNGTGGAINITVAGGTAPYGFLWSNGATTQNISGLASGNFTVTVTDALGCTDSDTYFVGQPDELLATGIVDDADCKNGCDGAIDITVTGGTAPYFFIWSNMATTEDISGLCEDTYYVTVTDNNSCFFVGNWTVGAPPALAVSGIPTAASCSTYCDGSIDITVSGGVGPYTYLWSDPAGSVTEDVSGLCAGTYFVTITDTHNCTLVDSWTVTEPGEVSWEGSTTNVSCYGGANGTITTIFTLGGTPPYTYAWSNGATTADLTGLTAGTYYLTVTDSRGCDARASRTIYQPDALVINPVATIVEPSCFGGSNGSIDITVTGGTLPYTFAWSTGATTQNISGLAAGCYDVTVTDALGCFDTETFCVGQPTQVMVTGIVDDADCKNGCDGAIDITATGGTAPYFFIWSTGATTEDISGLCEGTYYVTVTDNNGCPAYGNWTVGAPPALAVSGIPTAASCSTYCDGSIDITVSGGVAPYTYLWSDPAGTVTEDVSGLCAGTYFVTITDTHNCTLVDSWTVTEPGEVSWEGSTTNVSCKGGANGTVTTIFTLGGTPPYTYLWSNGATTADLTGLTAGTYYLTVTDSHSCDARAFRTIYEPDELVVSLDGPTVPALCYNGTGGAINITVAGGTAPYGFIWSTGATTQNISGLTSGNYTVTVTDALGCTDSDTYFVGQPDELLATGIVDDADCKNGCDGAIDITVTGGTAPYFFMWSNMATTEDISGLCEGTYYVTVTDGNQCFFTGNWTVGAPPALAVSGIPTAASCSTYCDGSINITVSGGVAPYTYLWSDPAGSVTEDVSGLCAGTYFVTITDTHNCTLVDSWTVTEPGEVSWEGSTTNVSCKGGANGTVTTIFTLGGTPPYTYAWSNGATTADLTGLTAGTYYLTVTDAHSCDARAFRTIYEPDELVVSLDGPTVPALCYNGTGGAINITVTGGTAPYGFIWSNGATTQNISGLAPGSYTVTVTDNLGCTDSDTYIVGQPDELLAIGVVTDILCKDDCNGSINITVTGGTMPYRYLWSNGAMVEDPSGLCEGTYYVTVTDDHSCEFIGNWSVGSPAPLSVTGIPTAASCSTYCDGSINITVNGGTAPYTYLWSDPAGSITEDVTGLCAGTYFVTITDTHNCTLVDSWTVTEPGEVSWEGSTTNVSCYGGANGTITTIFTLGGTPPYTYLWSNGATTADLTGLTAGTYYLTVTDANSCDARAFRTIYQPDALVINPVGTIVQPSCYGGSNGSIDITVTGGTLPYTFAWSTGATTQNISGLAAGCYDVTVTDALGCFDTETFCIGQPDQLLATGIVDDADCKNGCDGAIDITVTGGTAPYFFIWSNMATTEDISGLCEGTYYVTVTDNHGCIFNGNWTVGAPPALAVSGIPTAASCSTFCDGSINITVSGGVAPYTYLWSDPAGSVTEDVTGLCAGTYFVTITDTHNCTLVDSWTVTEPGEVSWEGSTTNVSCKGGANGTVTTIFTLGGTPPYTYAWSNGATTADLTGLTAGTYYLTVTDSHSCDARAFRTIYEPDELVVSLTGPITNVTCNGFSNGAIDITVTGGTMPYTFIWSNGATTEDLAELTAGCYDVTVTDALSCVTYGHYCVTQPDELLASGTKTDALCKDDCNGTINVTVTGGTMPYEFAWSNGATTEDLTGLCDGVYFVTITDAQSCDARLMFYITEPEELVIGQPVVTNATCFGASNGSINGGIVPGTPPTILPIPVTGGTAPYTYLWSNGQTTDNLCCLTAGCYTVTVTDANGCQDIETWCITEPPALSLDAAITNILCYGNSTGAIDLTVSGGTPPVQSYLWSNGATTEDISGLTAGFYSVTVEDYNGCVITGTWEVTQPTELVVDPNASITNVSCNGFADGAIAISVSGGTTPYTYLWSNGETTQNIGGLTAGCYTVTVTDANSCEDYGTWCVTQPDPLDIAGAVTSVECYLGSTGAIDITVTGGTMPYDYLWSNGATTEDINGLVAGIYVVTVTDAHNCTLTESFQVLEPPMWSVGIEGPTAACCNAPGVDDYYANVFGVPQGCNVTYEWVVTGGTIVSGWNTAHIQVDWECCITGTVTVTATKCDGCFVSNTLNVSVSLPPAPVLTGPATVYSNGVDQYCVEPAIPGHLYTWTVVNGSYTTIPGSNCITVTWGAYPACGCGYIIVCETDPVTGCTGCDTLYVTMLPDPNSISIEGTVSYKNGLPNTPMNGVTVKLRNMTSGQIIATTVTGPNMNPPLYTGDPGYYAFTNLPAGNYRLEASYNGAWGGNNATDALLIQLEAGNPGTVLFGLYKAAADVNASNTVSALDALYVKLRTVGSINSYPAGDWIFESPTVTLPVAGPVDFAGLCYGDVNGSYIPTGLKEMSFLSVSDDETVTVPVEETFTYEIRSNMIAKLGAMTLFMGYDESRFEVIDVNATSNDEMKYVIENGNVAIAWADTKPMSVRNDDQLFTLTVKAKAPITEAMPIFSVRAGSEFASPTGVRFDNFDVKMSKVITSGSSKEFSMFNYPNPFNATTKIVYTLPESGQVTLALTDMFGKTVRTLVNDVQAAGTHSITVNAAELNLSAGVYLYRIEAAGATENYVKVNKLIFTK